MIKAKPRLLLLSDIWGETNSEWTCNYSDILGIHFDIKFYDVCKLAGIDKKKLSTEEVHQEFLNGGIDCAVKRLLNQEKETVVVLGFSIGGLIAWKAALSGLDVTHLFAISSTRLRYEMDRPKAKINLFYGSLDTFIPNTSWFDKLKIEHQIYQNEQHQMYRKPEIACDISNQIMLILTLLKTDYIQVL